jgi:metallophosphoesterase (TIGR00282 family)
LEKYNPDFVIVNGENAAGGFGITPDIADKFFSIGVDVITSGNHIWQHKDIYPYLNRKKEILRPANYPDEVPGKGFCIVKKGDIKLGVVNVLGRIFMDAIDCPFRAAKRCVDEIKKETNIIAVDFHAEATSEKNAMGYYLDGEVTCVFGTHTHVQTADESILNKGTAYITDIGMVGPKDSVIGMDKEKVIERFLTLPPSRFEVAEKKIELDGILITSNTSTGLATEIKRINLKTDL